MTTGQAILGVVGGVVGFIYGGPVGAAAGFGLGVGIGGYIDPPSRPDIGKPQIQALNITTAKEGDVVPELLGISKLPGNIIHYWENKTVEIKEEQGGKGGGGQEVTTGYNYYLSWLQGICLGPTDYLYAVYMGDDVVWAGELERPVSGGQETITLTNYSDDEGNGSIIGNMTFYFGTADQVANPLFLDGIDDPTLNIPYRNLCYAFFDNCLINAGNRCPVFSFILAKRPTLSFNANKTINTYDYNPAHAIWWILEQMTDLPSSFLDETSFSAAADILNTENFGTSILFDTTASANTYIDNILLHIGGIKFYDTDGKLKIKLIRMDEDEGDMLSISDNDLIESPIITRGSWMETVNEIHGIYPLRILENLSANIFGLFDSGEVIYGVNFDGAQLSILGYYESPGEDINGLVFHEDNLLTVGGIGPTASLRVINSTPVEEELKLISETTPFNNYDIISAGMLTKDDSTGNIYYIETTRLLKITSTLIKELRSFPGTVTIGTDSLNYYPNATNSSWDSDKRPITGTFWDGFNDIIPDNLTDRTPVTWGTGTLYTNGGIELRSIVFNDSVYGALPISPDGRIRKYALGDLAIEVANENTNLVPYEFKGFGNYIFSVEGSFSCTLSKYNKDTLVSVDSVSLSPGRADDIAVTSEYIIVLNEGFSGSDGAIFKIDPSDLTVIDTYNLAPTVDLQGKIAVINDTYIVLAGNNTVGVFNLDTMTMVDTISVPAAGSGITANGTKELIVS